MIKPYITSGFKKDINEKVKNKFKTDNFDYIDDNDNDDVYYPSGVIKNANSEKKISK